MTPDWLSQLAPAHAPPPPGYWPPGPGWWGLAWLLAAGLIGYALWRLWRRKRSRAVVASPEQLALGELARLEPLDDPDLARDLADLLRRYAVVRHGREAVAGLSGETWLAFLAEHGGGDLAGEAGRALLIAAYGGQATSPRDAWLRGARGFIAWRPPKPPRRRWWSRQA